MNINVNKKYVKIGAIILAAVAIVFCVGFVGIKAFYNKMVVKENRAGLENIPKYDRNENIQQKDINQNIAVFGVDKDEMRTDVIFVVNLNTETNEIKVIAVPRDTKVTWSQFQQEKMAELGKGYHEYSKITEMSAYGGIDNLRYFTVNTLEDIMGITIDHYVVINIDAFRKIVDAIGGVEVNVPRRMEYNDSYQDLHIDLEPGLQLLNGEQAEGLVRWRHNEDYSEQYAEGDVGRIETQQLFMKALAQKVLSKTSPLDLLKVATVVYSDLKTDIQFSDLKTYLGYASQFSASDISFNTLPGEAVREDKWYYILNQPEVDAFMQKVLYNIDVPIAEDESSQDTTDSIDSLETITQPDTSDDYEAPRQSIKALEEKQSIEQEDTDERSIPLPTQKPSASQGIQEEGTGTSEVTPDAEPTLPEVSEEVPASSEESTAMPEETDQASEETLQSIDTSLDTEAIDSLLNGNSFSQEDVQNTEKPVQ